MHHVNSYLYISPTTINNFTLKVIDQFNTIPLRDPLYTYFQFISEYLPDEEIKNFRNRLIFYTIASSNEPLDQFGLIKIKNIKANQWTNESKYPFYHTSPECVKLYLRELPISKKAKFRIPQYLDAYEKDLFTDEINRFLAQGDYKSQGRNQIALLNTSEVIDFCQKYKIEGPVTGFISKGILAEYKWTNDEEEIKQNVAKYQLSIFKLKQNLILYERILQMAKNNHIQDFKVNDQRFLDHLGIGEFHKELHQLIGDIENYISAVENYAALHDISYNHFTAERLVELGFRQHNCQSN